MKDRKLLELAAKAAGMKVAPLDGPWGPPDEGAWFYNANGGGGMFSIDARPMRWNPLTDDGDALRLAVKLGLAVIPYPIYAQPKHSVIAKRYEHARYLRGESNDVEIEEITIYQDDPAAATGFQSW